MKLADHLALHGLSPSQFAARVGVPASTITRLISGARKPRLDTMQRIREATDGEVSFDDWANEASARVSEHETAA